MHRVIRPREDVTEAVFEAVAEETGRRPWELRPLGERFDTDAIESLFTRTSLDSPESLTLRYEGCRVTIGRDAVAVERIADA
jgi:hypothetical protein